MKHKKISLAVPYKMRARNLRIMLECVAKQENFDLEDVEVIVGAMEMGDEILEVVQKFPQLSVVVVITGKDFTITSARNLALRQCTGEVIVHVDADTALGPHALANLYDRHFEFGQNVCVVGQMIGYDNNAGDDVDTVDDVSYDAICDKLKMFEVTPPHDERFTVPHRIPWAFTWTGLVAIRAESLFAANLFFDETFCGWGVDDLEWGYRVMQQSIPIMLDSDVVSMNLPHLRKNTANRQTESHNYGLFLKKWPGLDVELAATIGDVDANRKFSLIQQNIFEIFGEDGAWLSIEDGVSGRELRLGLNRDEAIICHRLGAEIMPLLGMSIPVGELAFEQVTISPRIARLDSEIAQYVRSEAQRVAKSETQFLPVKEIQVA